jgi:hypothetical protein
MGHLELMSSITFTDDVMMRRGATPQEFCDAIADVLYRSNACITLR